MFSILGMLAVPLIGYLLSRLYKTYHNYTIACQTGLTVIFAPVNPYGVFWFVAGPLLEPFLRKLPVPLTAWARSFDLTWSWQDGTAIFDRYGSNYLVVHAEGINLVTADATAITAVLQQRKDFIKGNMYEPLNIFGRNVDTVNGDEWNRHRKLTAPCFNERVSGFVWDEAIRQSESMVEKWLRSAHHRVNSLIDDTRVIALHVLLAAGFGSQQDFNTGATKVAKGHTMSHRDALMVILDDILNLFIGLWRVKWLVPYLPKRVQQVGTAVQEFQQYMDEMIDQERESLKQTGNATKANLISQLIRTSDAAREEGLSKSSIRLTDEEIRGNIFIFNLAGHDTTANTLAYAFTLLALYPEYQEWVYEEVTGVFKGEENVYEETFPKLKRTMAVIYETLRLYGPVAIIPRSVSTGAAIPINPRPSSKSSSITVPPGSTNPNEPQRLSNFRPQQPNLRP